MPIKNTLGTPAVVKNQQPDAPWDSARAFNLAAGYTAQTFPQWAASGTVALTSQRMVLAPAFVFEGDQIGRVYLGVTSAAASLTLAKVALFDSGLNLLQGSASLHASVNGATGNLALSLGTTWTSARDQWIYLAFLAVGTTPPTVLRASGTAGLSAPPTSGALYQFAHQDTLPDLPAGATPVVTSAAAVWLGAN